ncbi:hypothetical protein Ancab_024426 [Ancistrocladus abbreviatus]
MQEMSNTSHQAGEKETPLMSASYEVNPSSPEKQKRPKGAVKYKECLKNHAAAIGGNATDGCGEFMPGGAEGSIDALKCSACHCHRNFHRKEIEGECLLNHYHHSSISAGRKLDLGHQELGQLVPNPAGYPSNTLSISNLGGGSNQSESDELEDNGGGDLGVATTCGQVSTTRKRFRTKFSEEQKAKMLNFAEVAGWKMQKLDDSVVQQFCQEIGIKRRVLKVWMHNNKHNFIKKNSSDR